MAAVDPGAYRNFTPPKYANFQDAWDRVAGGELALKERLKGKLTTDANGYLRLGGASDAPSVHVGAYVQQQPLIDAVVNETWVPDARHDGRQRAAGPHRRPRPVEGREEAREAVRRHGLGHPGRQGHPHRAAAGRRSRSRSSRAPSPTRSASTATPSSAAAASPRTPTGCASTSPPRWCRSWARSPATRSVFPQLKAALQEIIDRGLDDKIHPEQFAGCYYPRFIAGSSTLSNHAFGLALDINAVENQRGTVGLIDRGVVQIFQKWGFTWGGDWRYTDPMHFELNSVVTPRLESARK